MTLPYGNIFSNCKTVYSGERTTANCQLSTVNCPF